MDYTGTPQDHQSAFQNSRYLPPPEQDSACGNAPKMHRKSLENLGNWPESTPSGKNFNGM
jgi:hypothetical protein